MYGYIFLFRWQHIRSSVTYDRVQTNIGMRFARSINGHGKRMQLIPVG